MADVKWIKITTDMFDNRKIKHLRRLPDGNNVVLIWVMLLTMAGRCNAGGMIFLTENIPYTPKMLADELDFEENTVMLALEALQRFNMIMTDANCLRIAGWDEYQNIEGMDKIRQQNRIRKQRQREKKVPALPPAEGVSRDSHVTVTPCHATDKELDIELDKKEDKDKKSVRETTPTLFERLLPEYLLSESVADKMRLWIKYKMERKEPYKEQGMKSLLRQVENQCQIYGDSAICDLIEECMANGWKGLIFDRLKNMKSTGNGGVQHGKPGQSADENTGKVGTWF